MTPLGLPSRSSDTQVWPAEATTQRRLAGQLRDVAGSRPERIAVGDGAMVEAGAVPLMADLAATATVFEPGCTGGGHRYLLAGSS